MSKKDKITAAAFSFFLGYFGVHQFYLGNAGKGLVYLFTVGFCGILPVVDGVSYLLMSDDDFNRRFNPHLFQQAILHNTFTDFIGDRQIEVADEIAKLNQLWKEGIITFEEFERRKNKLIG
ncbi:MAG TPA: hypothetical protein DCM08_07180 [Microscillaceae bacterium]|jgi:TM2 domain-containing membrane protein YozV|nr:hypothetical protein [Microscillaceae bacterium]